MSATTTLIINTSLPKEFAHDSSIYDHSSIQTFQTAYRTIQLLYKQALQIINALCSMEPSQLNNNTVLSDNESTLTVSIPFFISYSEALNDDTLNTDA